MNSTKTAIILLSRSGGGKGTQAEFLREYFGKEKALSITTGDGFRDLAKRADLLAGKYIQEKVLDVGEKAPDFSTIWIWANRMIYEFTPETSVVIFDGTPRTRLEAQALDEALEFFEIENVKPLLLDVERKEAIQRLLSRARADDTRERIERRLAYYERTVKPAIEYYKIESKNQLIVIDGMPLPEKVFEQIKRVVSSK